MVPGDFDEVAELIHLSTNAWYQQHFSYSIFQGKPEECRIVPEVYEDLDPGGGVVVVNDATRRIVGSSFSHPRETHVSLGILNVHPNYFGRGVAGKLVRAMIDVAEMRSLPLRLVSSALNLDSFSLYNRYGFVPKSIYQDMILSVPAKGMPELENRTLPTVREAEPSDLVAMGKIEFEVAGISRERDYCYFIENSVGIWKTLVSLDEDGEVDGYLVSNTSPAMGMIGPGVARNASSAEALIRAQADRFAGRNVVFLVPSDDQALVEAAYGMGARNCELHFSQVRGEAQPVAGVVMPAFFPESG